MDTLLEGSRRRIPRLTCALCGRSEDDLQGSVALRRICEDCYNDQTKAPPNPEPEGPPDPDNVIRNVDALFEWGVAVVRLTFYTILYLIARNTDFGPYILSGILLGDSTTWVAAAWLGRNFHSLAVFVEALIYMGVIAMHINFTGGFEIPDDPFFAGIMALTFIATFGTKGSLHAWKLLHGGGLRIR